MRYFNKISIWEGREFCLSRLYIGCSGFSYLPWVGSFYPKGLDRSKWLQYYAGIFDFVEVDSTFYSTPSLFRVKKWAVNTSAHFKFTAKLPKVITHEKAMFDCLRELEMFYAAMAPLRQKALAFLIQLPPSIGFKSGFKVLQNFVGTLDKRYRYAIEVRQNTWFNDDLYKFLKKEHISLVWSVRDEVSTPPVLTTDFVYLRFIGDRSIQEHEFGQIQKDRTQEMENWAAELTEAIDGLSFGIVAQNNHYAGFGPAP
jgi:uncharacterized protein YecE (DUF72 family)